MGIIRTGSDRGGARAEGGAAAAGAEDDQDAGVTPFQK